VPLPAQERVPAPENNPTPDWNELQFVSWDEFRRMAPSILQLEITRMDGLLPALGAHANSYNDVVRARFCVRQFVTCIEGAEKEHLEPDCAAHLHNAILSLSLPPDDLDAQALNTWRYVLGRLSDINRRLPLVY
jgi:hypothetical protein